MLDAASAARNSCLHIARHLVLRPPCPMQISEAKEFMKRRFVTKLASRNIAYKV